MFIINEGFKMILKEIAIAYFEILSQDKHGGAEENHP
jgi:hypothetical protein